MKYIAAFSTLFLLCSCNDKTVVQEPVAKVFESCLYRPEIADIIPKGTSAEDSVLMAQNYIRNWVTKKLLLHKAIENLSGEEKDIQRQVEDYRTSLLIHRYKQKFITQRLGDEIEESDVVNYYRENKNNFVLATPVVKAIFFILPKSASNLAEVRKQFRSSKPKDLENLEEYCISNAKKYDNFDGKWIEVKYILNLIPGEFSTLENDILYQKNIEKEDDENYYFLRINEMYREQTTAPLDYVRDEIILILKNKKKIQFEEELDKQINEEGLQKKYVEVF